jgi:hypothetical protein
LVLFEDSSIEAMFSDLAEHNPNGYLSSSEGGNILNSRLMSKTSILNSLYSGDAITVNRKKEGSFTLEGARVAVNIMPQPSALERSLKNNKDDIRGNGWLSRFLVCKPISNCGYRQANGVSFSRVGLDAFNDRLYQLLSQLETGGAMKLRKERKVVRLSDEAKSLWFDMVNDIEMKMRPEGIYFQAKDHMTKVPEMTVRVAAVMHCMDHSPDEPISVATFMEAMNITSYCSGQFMKVFCPPPKYITDADNLKQWLSVYFNLGIRYIKRNDILQRGPGGTRKKRDFEPAFDYLKSIGPIGEFMSLRTRIIDLEPHKQPDPYKLNQDMAVNIAYCQPTTEV